MQLSHTAFNRDKRHDQISNANRFSWNKINLVELHDGKATFVGDGTPLTAFLIAERVMRIVKRTSAMKYQQNADGNLQW
jgi:hypothetical protein